MSKKKLRYRWTKTLGLDPPTDIVPDIDVLYVDIEVGKDPRIGSTSRYRTRYRRFLCRYRYQYVNIDVYELRYRSKGTSISQNSFDIGYDVRCNVCYGFLPTLSGPVYLKPPTARLSSDSDSENGREMDNDGRRDFADQDLPGPTYTGDVGPLATFL